MFDTCSCYMMRIQHYCSVIIVKSSESRDVEKVQKTMNKSKMLKRLKYKDIGQVLKGSIGEANRI